MPESGVKKEPSSVQMELSMQVCEMKLGRRVEAQPRRALYRRPWYLPPEQWGVSMRFQHGCATMRMVHCHRHLVGWWRVERMERWEAGRLIKRLLQWSPSEQMKTKQGCGHGKKRSGVLALECPQRPSSPVSAPGPAYVCLCVSLLILLFICYSLSGPK